MNTFTLNTIAGWVLFTFLMVFGLNELSNVIYHAEAPEEPAIFVEVAEEEAVEEEVEEAAPQVQLASLLQEASVEDGQSTARACVACHSFEQGGANKVGPNLWNIVGQDVAGHEDFAYSDALQEKSDLDWTYEHLDAFLADPKGWAPGTKMTYGGLRRPERRADLIAYLRSLSDSPPPLPEPAAEAAEPAAESVDPMMPAATTAEGVDEEVEAEPPVVEGGAEAETEEPAAQ